jgi:chitodextrinase
VKALTRDSRQLIGAIAAAIALLGAWTATAQAADPVIAAAGDIACDNQDGNFNGGNGTATACRQKYTSNLLVNAGLAQVITLGDNQYNSAQTEEFNASYDPSWGRVKSITRPGIGNHEPGSASDYFDYFNGVGVNDGPAGERGKGYYSFDVGSWHVIALNSNCSTVACNAGSAQEQWLRADLAAHPNACTLAYWHHPRFSSGHDGDNTFMQPIWKALHEADADLALVGHSHDYERFAPQDVNGNLDQTRGIRQFVVGTGGAFFTGMSSAKPNSEVRQNSTYGVLKLALHPTSYDWNFVPEAGKTFTDSGSEACHGNGAPPPPSTTTMRVPAQADARVAEAAPTTNYGSSYLRTDGGADPDVESYLSFNVTGISSSVLSAKLRVYAYTDTGNGPAVYTTSSSWSETGITWNNRPAPTSAATDDKGAIAANSWVEYNVTPFVSGNGTYNFILATTSADGVDMYSREGADLLRRPELVLTVAAGSGDTEPPSAPTNLTATAPSSNRVDLSWNASADNVGVTGYEVFRGGALVGTTTGTNYTDPTVSADTTYTYEVTARDGAGNRSAFSNNATVTTPPDNEPPSAPSALTATASTANRVDLSWGASSDNTGVTGYEVFRGGALLATTPATSYSDTTVGAGTSYTYQVKARDAAGNRSTFSNSVTVTTPFTFSAQADAYVREADPYANYGSQVGLTVDGSPRFESYLTFNVGNVPGIVQSAKLRLYVNNGSPDGPAVYTTTSNWSETGMSGITWATRPAATSGVIADKSKITSGTWAEYDVTPVVIGNGTYSFLLRTSSSNDVRANSREALSFRPELTLTVG